MTRRGYFSQGNLYRVIRGHGGASLGHKKIKTFLLLEARGKPSTWLPRGGLVEHSEKRTKQLRNMMKFTFRNLGIICILMKF